MQPAFFLAGNRARDDVDVVVLKNMFTSTTSLHKDFVTVVLDSFLVNCFEKIVMATNSSGLSSNYLLVSEERRKRERRERERARIKKRRASEGDRQRERVRDRQRRRNSSEERRETERVRARENRRGRRERELQIQRERQPNSSILTEGE